MQPLRAAAALVIAFATCPLFAGGVADHVSVDSAYARAVAPGVSVSGAYMTISATDGAEHELVAAHSGVAENVELHNHEMEDGVMKMRRMESVTLPADTAVDFKPGGLHVMLIGLTEQLDAGNRIEIELEFEDGSRKAVTFDVK